MVPVRFRVVAGGASHSGHGEGRAGRDGHHEPPPSYASPVAPVRAGGGGTADNRASGGTEAARHIGPALAGAAVVAGAALWVVRRRRDGARAEG